VLAGLCVKYPVSERNSIEFRRFYCWIEESRGRAIVAGKENALWRPILGSLFMELVTFFM
ncbi:MAG TPA: hypothetical protein VMW90_09815, partial [Acidobacteriota bacterium]|nr:hypothetical protein [Acidobacteriota bacterium]